MLEFGKRLQQLRLQKDMSLRDLGSKTSISYSFIGSLEKGRFKPSRKTVQQLARGLDVDPNQLLPLAGFSSETNQLKGEIEETEHDLSEEKVSLHMSDEYGVYNQDLARGLLVEMKGMIEEFKSQLLEDVRETVREVIAENHKGDNGGE